MTKNSEGEVEEFGNQDTEIRESDFEIKESIWNYHTRLVQSTPAHDDVSENNELQHYLHQKVVDISEDPLLFWTKHELIYPKLSKVAFNYLCVVATSVSSERLFSNAGIIMEPHRNRLTGSRLGKLVFLNSLDLEQWLL